MSELDQSLSHIEKKLDNLEELLRMLLVQNVAWEISTTIDEFPNEISDTDILEPSVFIQYRDYEVEVNSLIDIVRATFFMEQGIPVQIEALRIYIKPEERAAYYVINQCHMGKVDF